MLSESQSASRKQEWAEANALAELSTEAVAKALAVVTETKLENVHRLLGWSRDLLFALAEGVFGAEPNGRLYSWVKTRN